MENIFKKIWNLALPYQDFRDDKGHAKITLNFALELLKTEKAKKEIVIPAIILHDIGWSQLSKKERFLIFSPKRTKKEELKVRLKHQEKSVELARKILSKVNYDKKLTKEILKIISQHDTGKNFSQKKMG